MRDCIYAVEEFDDLVSCENHHDIRHDGYVPKIVCEACPFSIRRGHRDFFRQTSDLFIHQHRQGKFNPVNPCSCGGEAKIPNKAETMRAAFRQILGDGWQNVAKNRLRSGDGIVIVGGGDYWPGIAVSIRMLRLVGCTLPVEVWHYGDREPVDPDEVADCGKIMFRDLSVESRRPLPGWPSKVHAIANTTFARVMFLDADAYCVADPTPLIQSTGNPFRYWRDVPREGESINWTEVWPHPFASDPTLCRPVQGGHLLIDIAAAWKLICVALWLNQKSTWYYRHMFGDQDTWRLALTAIGDKALSSCIGPSIQIGNSIVVGLRGESPMIVHRCNAKLFPPERRKTDQRVWDGVPCDPLPREADALQFFSKSLNRLALVKRQ